MGATERPTTGRLGRSHALLTRAMSLPQDVDATALIDYINKLHDGYREERERAAERSNTLLSERLGSSNRLLNERQESSNTLLRERQESSNTLLSAQLEAEREHSLKLVREQLQAEREESTKRLNNTMDCIKQMIQSGREDSKRTEEVMQCCMKDVINQVSTLEQQIVKLESEAAQKATGANCSGSGV